MGEQDLRSSPYRHDALLEEGSVKPEESKRLLRQGIRILNFGPGFDALVPELQRLNANLDRARAAYAERAGELIEQASRTTRCRSDAICGRRRRRGRRPRRPGIRGSHLTMVRATELERQREELFSLQRVARGLVDPRAVDRLLEGRFEDSGPEGDEELRVTARAARRTLALFPLSLLAALKQRGVQIKAQVLDGYAQRFLDELVEAPPSGPEDDRFRNPLGHPYYRENTFSVVDAVAVLMGVDPLRLFPAPAQGLGAVTSRRSLLVVLDDRIEIRGLDRPHEPEAVLTVEAPYLLEPGPSGFRGRPWSSGSTSPG